MSGLSSTGFVKKTLAEIKSEYEDSYTQSFGNGLNFRPPSLIATTIGIAADRESDIWDSLDDLYNSQYPDTANGVSLDDVCAITGTERKGALPSRILSQIFFGDEGTVIPATDTVLSVDGNPDAKFMVETEVTLGVGVNAVQHIAFNATPSMGAWTIGYGTLETGSLAYNAIAATIQIALRLLEGLEDVTISGNYTAGFDITFAGTSGKQVQALFTIPVNTTTKTITPTITTAGVPQAETSMVALDDGPTEVEIDTLINIVTPISGLDSTKNVSAAVAGRFVETDVALRLRRQDELQKPGAGPVEAVRQALLAVEGVTAAIVFENDTYITDINGLPAKSMKCFVQGGSEDDIGEALWTAKPGGIQFTGNVGNTITDSMGIEHIMYFSRPIEVPIYIKIEVTVDASFPSDGEDQVRAKLLAFIQGEDIGDDVVIYPQLIASINSVSGILDLRLGIDTSPNPSFGTDDNISISINELAVITDSETDIEVSTA